MSTEVVNDLWGVFGVSPCFVCNRDRRPSHVGVRCLVFCLYVCQCSSLLTHNTSSLVPRRPTLFLAPWSPTHRTFREKLLPESRTRLEAYCSSSVRRFLGPLLPRIRLRVHVSRTRLRLVAGDLFSGFSGDTDLGSHSVSCLECPGTPEVPSKLGPSLY